MSALSDKIKLLRGDKSRKAFAKQLDVSEGSLVKYEGSERVPNADFLSRLCKVTGADPAWLILDGNEQKVPTVGNFDSAQHIENIGSDKNKVSDVGSFSDLLKAQESELLTLYRENNQLVRENADLRAENSRLQSQLAAAEKSYSANQVFNNSSVKTAIGGDVTMGNDFKKK